MSEPTTWKILVAEDRAGIAAALLRGRGDFDVTAAQRLPAVERLLRDMPDPPFQAVLLDLALADIADPQGMDAFRRVRGMAPGVPIVALVASAAEEAASALAAEGAAACLPRQSATAEVLAWTLRQAALRAAGEARRFRQLFDSVPVGILLAAGRRVAMANPAALDFLGYSGEELRRVSVVDLFAPDLRATLESALDASVAGEIRESDFRADLVRKDGSPARARVLLKGALLNDAPALAFYLTVAPAQDAPSRDPGPKMEALGRLADGLGHDFNNLLTAINGYSDHLLSLPGVEGGPLARGLGAIRKAGDAAAALVRGLTDFSQPGTGDAGPVDVDAALGELAPSLGAMLGAMGPGGRGLIDIRPGAESSAALLEPGQLERILITLCMNAGEAGPPPGGLTVSTGTAESADSGAFTHLRPAKPGPYVVIAVRDAGRGMVAEEMERLFEPRFSSKGFRGSGFGLSAVYGIVRRAGGGISVQSRPGQGSLFRIWLPQAGPLDAGRAEAGEARFGPAIPPEAAPAVRVGGRKRVTVVEDEPTLREMLRAVLERSGFEVAEATSGEEAEAALASGDIPDVLVTDVLLRDGLGTEMVERMRAAHPGLRTLFISGHSLDVLEERGISIAPEEFLEKPFTPSQLAAKVGGRLESPARPAP